MEFRSKSLEQLDVAAASVAKMESRSHANAMDASEIAGELADELIAGFSAEGFIEFEQENGLGMERGDGQKLLRQRINQGRDTIRGNDGIRVSVESHNHRSGFVL